jgi:F0F1-type ATP synthase assembly protein I
MFNKYTIVALFHSLIVGPLLIYVGYEKENSNKKVLDILFIFGILTIIYHLLSLFNVSMPLFIISIFILGIIFGLYLVPRKNEKSNE